MNSTNTQLLLRGLRCPSCFSALRRNEDSLECIGCGHHYPMLNQNGVLAIRLLADHVSAEKSRIQRFWGDIYQQWYSHNDQSLQPEVLVKQLKDLENLFQKRRHMAVVEMDLSSLSELEVCEIGCGAGGHSALFRSHGAHMTSVDITQERVLSTAQKLSLLCDVPSGSGRAIQADAEALPFPDGTFDIVYSNGVLHHTESTDKSIKEVFRILKPGGRAVIMLYARHSAYYWTQIVPAALLTGDIFRYSEAEWIGRRTEGKPSPGVNKNPITRVYSGNQLRDLFQGFTNLEFRKDSFQLSQLFFPWSGYVRNLLMRIFFHKPHPGGLLVYGKPMFPENGFELLLGPRLGFAWFIQANKPIIQP